MRNLIRRHPDLFLKSWASFDAKTQYLTKKLAKNLDKEKTFPLLLHFNYNGVIRPRCELLRPIAKQIDLEAVLPLSDEQFCAAFDITPEDLENEKSQKTIRDEKDVLWAYVAGL